MRPHCVENHYDNDFEPCELVGGNNLFITVLQKLCADIDSQTIALVLAQANQIDEFQDQYDETELFSKEEIENLKIKQKVLLLNDEAIFKKMKSSCF
jgi:hypothetical protein